MLFQSQEAQEQGRCNLGDPDAFLSLCKTGDHLKATASAPKSLFSKAAMKNSVEDCALHILLQIAVSTNAHAFEGCISDSHTSEGNSEPG